MGEQLVSLRVWGNYACFSRPEFKVERVSYPTITPSAARGVLEAIFWRPEMRYEIRRIGVLALGSQTTILRNEISDRQGRSPIFVEAKRQQRSSLVLKGVDYVIQAAVIVRPHTSAPAAKYLDQIRRRIGRGQHFQNPYLGTREFAANVEPWDGRPPEPISLAIGTMLFDLAFIESRARSELTFRRPDREEPAAGFAEALFFDARIENGWLDVPVARYQDLYRLEGRHV
jgi:CRISPR-associated protein Cas5d